MSSEWPATTSPEPCAYVRCSKVFLSPEDHPQSNSAPVNVKLPNEAERTARHHRRIQICRRFFSPLAPPELRPLHNSEAVSPRLTTTVMSRNVSHGRGGAGKSTLAPDQRSNSDRGRTQATSPDNSRLPTPATSSLPQSSRMFTPPAVVAPGIWPTMTPNDRRLRARARTLSPRLCGQNSTPTTRDEV